MYQTLKWLEKETRRSNKYCLNFPVAWGLLICRYNWCPPEVCFALSVKDWEITRLIAPDLLIKNPSVPGNATRSVAKTLVPSLLDLTSLASLHPTKSSSLPLVNLWIFWEYCCLSSFMCVLLSLILRLWHQIMIFTWSWKEKFFFCTSCLADV